MPLSSMARRDFLKLTLMGGVAAGAQHTAAHAAPAPGPVELRMWNNHPEWKNALLANLAVFEKSSGIKIQLEPKPGPEYVQLLSAAVQAGEAPDVPGIPPGPLLDQFLDNGYVLDLTGKVHVDRLTPLCQERATRKGKIVGIPFGAYTIGMYYQKEIFSKNGIREPKTWDELKAACEKLKKAGITPLMMPAKDGVIPSWYYMLAAASVLGRAGFKDLLAGKRKLSDPDLAAVPQLLVDLAAYYPEGFASISYAEGKATFARGGTAMILGGTADYAGYVAVNKDAKLDFFPFPPPSASAGAPATLTGFELINAVSKNSKQTVIAVQVLLVMRELKLIGSPLSLICAYAALSLPMSVLFLTSFFATIPAEIEEAARVDGAGPLRVLLAIVLPLARPGIAAVVILAGVWMWNDFIVALILATRPSIHTLPVGIMSFFGVYSTEWTLAFASVAIAATPFLLAYLALTRQFIAGLSVGAVRG